MPTPRSVLVLANAAAGSVDDEALEAALTVLRKGADVEVVVPEGPDSMSAVVANAKGRDIVLIGGDGSLHGCLAAVAEHGLLGKVGPIGIVPMGTGNDFARAMGLPFDPAAAAEVALHGPERAVDLLLDDQGGVVVNVAHAGAGAEATALASRVKGVLGTAAYTVGALGAGVKSRGSRLRVTLDGEVVLDGSRPVLMVAVAVGPSIGGGTSVAPSARPDDGLVTVVTSTATGPLARAGFALALRRGRHTSRGDVTVAYGTEVTVAAVPDEEVFLLNVDGDVGEPRRSCTWTIAPQAWVCRVPDGGRAASCA